MAALLATTLRLAGHEVHIAQNAQQAHSALSSQRFDAAIIDWMLPTTTGIELIAALRLHTQHRSLPILMLTAKALENDKIAGLDAGADDYLTKPFSPRELSARLKALLRRAQPLRDDTRLSVGAICLQPSQGTVSYQPTLAATPAPMVPVQVSSTEFKLLHCLMLAPNRVHSRDSLLAQAWEHSSQVDARTIDAHIKRLRQALASVGCEDFIHTVRGMGYTLNAAL